MTRKWRPRPLPAWVTPVMQEQIIGLAEQGMPEEVCGFVTTTGRVVQLPNVSPNPIATFEMDQVATVAAMKIHGMPRSTWHSHPRGSTIPSRADATMARLTRIPLLIATLSGLHYWSVAQCNDWLWSYEHIAEREPGSDGPGPDPVGGGQGPGGSS